MKTATNKPKISITNNRKVKVFLFILLLTSIIWLLIELSKTYVSTALFEVQYTNIPTGKLLHSKPIKEVNITLKAPGFSLLKYKIRKNKLNLSLRNVVRRGSNHYVLPNQQIANLTTQLSGETEIITVLNDTIYIELGNNKSKKVPINPMLDIKFKLGYNLTEPIKIKPDSVLITGSERLVDSIQELETEVLKISNAYKNIDRDLDIIMPLESLNIIVEFKSVSISGVVDKFTEGKFIIPVTFINKPAEIIINTFPKEIEVVYQGGLSNFNKITTNSFLIVCDYEQYKKDTLIKYLTPVIKHKSEFISSLKVNPSQIEFLIQK